MRKLVSILVIAVMVLALAAPVFSVDGPSEPPPGFDGDVSSEVPTIGDVIGPDGQKLDVEVSAPKLAPDETLESVVEDAVKAAEDAGLDIKEATRCGSLQH